VGRNKATTFTGLCEHHDRRLFAQIDASDLDWLRAEHRFLLAYRAVLYELHATCRAAWQLQHAYMRRVKLGLSPPNETSRAGRIATGRLIVAFETYQYKQPFDKAHLVRDFSAVEHDLLMLKTARPTVAASVMFTIDHLHRDAEVVRACMTILPVSQTLTACLFSYLPADADLARAALRPIFEARDEDQKYLLSKRLINSAQNFVLSPRFVDAWSPSKRKAVLKYFLHTALSDDLAHDDPELTLF
jgi:hypothetical protein